MSKDIRVISSKVNYVTDKKSMFEIEKCLLSNGLKLFSFGEILFKIGFDKNKTLYLKRIKDDNKYKYKYNYGLDFYYSYEKNSFSDDKIIHVGSNYARRIEVREDALMREYSLSRTYSSNNDICVNNRFYENEKIENGISFYYKVFDDKLRIIIKNNMGDELWFDVDFLSNDETSKMIKKLNDNDDLDNYIFNIKFDDDIDKIFKNIFDYIKIDYDSDYNYVRRNLALTYLKDEILESGYWIEKNQKNNNMEVKLKNSDIGVCTYKVIYNLNNCELTVLNDLYKLKLELNSKDKDYSIKNEEELRKYLLTLKFPIRIEDVFKKMFLISLGDISDYTYINFSQIYDGYKYLDRIELKNNNLEYFRLTRDGKMYELNNSGEFRYISNGDSSEYLISMNNDLVTEYRYKNTSGIELGDDTRGIYKVIGEAKNEKVRVRKLVDEMTR